MVEAVPQLFRIPNKVTTEILVATRVFLKAVITPGNDMRDVIEMETTVAPAALAPAPTTVQEAATIYLAATEPEAAVSSGLVLS